MPPFSFRETTHALLTLCALTLFASLLLISNAPHAHAQAIGAHRSNVGGTGGSHTIQGRIINPSGKLSETRIRIVIEHTDAGTRSTVADDDGTFLFSNLEGGTYRITIDAGKEFETVRESVYIEDSKVSYNLPIYLRLKPEANPAMAGVPRPALELFSKALEAEQKNDIERAVALLGEAIKLHPDFALAHSELGMIYMRTNQLDQSIEAHKAAIKALPDDPGVQLNYGIALTQKKDFAEAEKQLRRGLKKLDKSSQGHMYLGVSLIALKKNDEAESELRQAVKLGGDLMGAAHKYLGGIYWGKGDFKRAADELEIYVKLMPKASDAERIRGTIKELRSKS
jgi:Flp pilus assembly protein TadD